MTKTIGRRVCSTKLPFEKLFKILCLYAVKCLKKRRRKFFLQPRVYCWGDQGLKFEPKIQLCANFWKAPLTKSKKLHSKQRALPIFFLIRSHITLVEKTNPWKLNDWNPGILNLWLQFYRISLSIKATNLMGYFLSIKYLYTFLVEICFASIWTLLYKTGPNFRLTYFLSELLWDWSHLCKKTLF